MKRSVLKIDPGGILDSIRCGSECVSPGLTNCCLLKGSQLSIAAQFKRYHSRGAFLVSKNDSQSQKPYMNQ